MAHHNFCFFTQNLTGHNGAVKKGCSEYLHVPGVWGPSASLPVTWGCGEPLLHFQRQLQEENVPVITVDIFTDGASEMVTGFCALVLSVFSADGRQGHFSKVSHRSSEDWWPPALNGLWLERALSQHSPGLFPRLQPPPEAAH